MSKISLLMTIGVIGGSAILPAAASAEQGWMNCQVVDHATKSVYFSEKVFKADSQGGDKGLDVYLAALRAENPPKLPDLTKVQGFCNWAKKASEANSQTAGFVGHFTDMGYSMQFDRHMPDPFAP